MIRFFRKLKRKQFTEWKCSQFNLCLNNSLLMLLWNSFSLCLRATLTELLKFILHAEIYLSFSTLGQKTITEIFSALQKANIEQLLTVQEPKQQKTQFNEKTSEIRFPDTIKFFFRFIPFLFQQHFMAILWTVCNDMKYILLPLRSNLVWFLLSKAIHRNKNEISSGEIFFIINQIAEHKSR